MVFRKPCKRCGEMYQPSSKWAKLCEKCLEKARKMKIITSRKRREERARAIQKGFS